MAGKLSTEEMVKLVLRDAQAEADRDLEATMATLVDDPYFEIWPNGYTFSGREAVTEWYRPYLTRLTPAPIEPVNNLNLWCGDDTLVSEDIAVMQFNDGSRGPIRTLSIWSFEGALLKGERAYFDERGAHWIGQHVDDDFARRFLG